MKIRHGVAKGGSGNGVDKKSSLRGTSSLKAALRKRIPAMSDFRAKGTIIGPTGLTAVFGMGTGVAPPVWSPGIRHADG